MSILKVVSYDRHLNAHKCEGSDLRCQYVNIMSDGDLPEGTKPEDLIGKIIEYNYTISFIEIAMECKIIGDDGKAGQLS